ncbi:MAG: haloacid dehalogenase-like hydrolase [Calothrix sp. C42_A2020_038]|nr:haloacid dehalogenase-like hydrolase [Calothrix sp. C42_A2020_038]
MTQSSEVETLSFFRDQSKASLVILDFDETLLLRNSTEEYLNTIQPRAIAAIILYILDAIKPWKFLPGKTGGDTCRDWIRVLVLTILFPWNIFLWRNHACQLAANLINTELVAAITTHKSHKIVVATKGFEFIVQPMIKQLNFAIHELIGCRFWLGCIDRHKNKEDLIARKISLAEIKESVVVTDSRDDASLLAIVKHPFLVIWEQAKYIPAMQDAYIPLFYLEKVKRPGQQTIKKIIIKNHLVSLILALSLISSHPIFHITGITLLVIAFWCIYELGYYENDQIAEKFEQKPVLSATYHQYKSKMNQWQPWYWAVFISFLGVGCIEASQIDLWQANHLVISELLVKEHIQDLSIKFSLWLSILLFTRLTYVAYNYLDKQTRIWIYPILQVWKFFGFLVVSISNLVGVILLFSQLLVEWIPYSIYRCGGNRHNFKEQIFRFFIYIFLCLIIAIGMHDASLLINPQFAIILIWAGLRSKSELMGLWSNAYLLSQTPPSHIPKSD